MKLHSLLLFTFIIAFLSCNPNTGSSNTSPSNSPKKHIGKVKAEVFNQKLEETANAQLIDVRTPEEFNEGHLQNALNINFYDKNFKEQMTQLDKDRPVFVYCKSGGRSGKCTKMLKDVGFTEVYDLAGGYKGWSKK